MLFPGSPCFNSWCLGLAPRGQDSHLILTDRDYSDGGAVTLEEWQGLIRHECHTMAVTPSFPIRAFPLSCDLGVGVGNFFTAFSPKVLA